MHRIRIACLCLITLTLLALWGCAPLEKSTVTPREAAANTAAPKVKATTTATPRATAVPIDEDGVYTSRDDLALYLHTYGKLPRNFLTKAQARALGWQGGDLQPYRADAAIGGDRFGNYEGLLPNQFGRVYYECDVDTLHRSSRGAKRLVYSSDGLIYYTGDHYESFTLLFGGSAHADD